MATSDFRSTLIVLLFLVVMVSSEDDKTERQNPILQQGAEILQSRIGHRLKMLFPLIVAIAMRLATLIPIGIATLTGVTIMVMLSGKAFLVSLVALALTVWDKFSKKSQPVIQYVHRPHIQEHHPEHPPHDHQDWPFGGFHDQDSGTFDIPEKPHPNRNGYYKFEPLTEQSSKHIVSYKPQFRVYSPPISRPWKPRIRG